MYFRKNTYTRRLLLDRPRHLLALTHLLFPLPLQTIISVLDFHLIPPPIFPVFLHPYTLPPLPNPTFLLSSSPLPYPYAFLSHAVFVASIRFLLLISSPLIPLLTFLPPPNSSVITLMRRSSMNCKVLPEAFHNMNSQQANLLAII